MICIRLLMFVVSLQWMLGIKNKHRFNCLIIVLKLAIIRMLTVCVLEICTFCPSETRFQKQNEFKITRTWSKRKYAECLHKPFTIHVQMYFVKQKLNVIYHMQLKVQHLHYDLNSWRIFAFHLCGWLLN